MEINKNYDLKEIVYFCEYDKVYKTEIFKDVPGYEGHYKISDLGRLRSVERKVKINRGAYRIVKERILKSCIRRDGYLYVILKKPNKPIKNFSIHQLVAMAFLSHKRCGFEKVVDHKNNNKKDNRFLNIQLLTNRENSTKDIKNKTGYVGVTDDGSGYRSTIRENGVSIYLGTFRTAELANNAYLERRKIIEEKQNNI